MEINEIFSANLARLRKLKNLSQRDLAKATGLTQRIVNYYENKPKSIPIEKLKTLAAALDAKVSDFFNESGSSKIDDIDIRLVKKINELKSLSEADRKEINRHISSLLEKNKLKKEKSMAGKSK
jgi:transcriptional regulator with XRE-family HTH domain